MMENTEIKRERAVLAGLAAEGRSEILDISHIDRGYGAFEYKLRSLGADIVRVSV